MHPHTFIKFIQKVFNQVEIGWLWGLLHCMIFFLFLCIHVFTIVPLCLGSLSCWNALLLFKFSAAYGSKCSCKTLFLIHSSVHLAVDLYERTDTFCRKCSPDYNMFFTVFYCRNLVFEKASFTLRSSCIFFPITSEEVELSFIRKKYFWLIFIRPVFIQ